MTRAQFANHAMNIAVQAMTMARKSLMGRFPGQPANSAEVAQFCRDIREAVDDLEHDNKG